MLQCENWLCRPPLITIMLAIALSSCSWLNKPYLYGNDSCGEGKTAYVYTSGTAAICLNEKSVAYIICSREPGVISDVKNKNINGNLSAPISGANVTGGVNASSDSTTLYASEDGELVSARAEAIKTCTKIYNNYK